MERFLSFWPLLDARKTSNFHIRQDMAPTKEYSFVQLIEPSQKGLYDRDRILKYMKVTYFARCEKNFNTRTLGLSPGP